jgi:hypothetical protein
LKRTAEGFEARLLEGVAVLHLTRPKLRGTVSSVGLSGGLPMHLFTLPKLVTWPKRHGLGAVLGLLLGLLAFGPAAHAANEFELNFGLSGPKYDGRVGDCEAALLTVMKQFREKESTFWNSSLEITGYGRIHEIAFRPWQSDNIPRRYCSGDVMLNDGRMRTVHYSIIEDGGFASFGQGVEWCVTGLDRNWAYNPGCRAARP